MWLIRLIRSIKNSKQIENKTLISVKLFAKKIDLPNLEDLANRLSNN